MLCDLIYFFSPKKSPELIRRVLKKNPRWARGHLLLAESSKDQRLISVSIAAIEALGAGGRYLDRIGKLPLR